MKQLDMIEIEPVFSFQNNITNRLEQAYQYAQLHQQFNEAVFTYQDFALSIKDLMAIALGKSINFVYYEKVERCFEHMLFHKYENNTYWSYQKFSFTLCELMEECMKKVKPQAISQIKQDMKNFHKDYLNKVNSVHIN